MCHSRFWARLNKTRIVCTDFITGYDDTWLARVRLAGRFSCLEVEFCSVDGAIGVTPLPHRRTPLFVRGFAAGDGPNGRTMSSVVFADRCTSRRDFVPLDWRNRALVRPTDRILMESQPHPKSTSTRPRKSSGLPTNQFALLASSAGDAFRALLLAATSTCPPPMSVKASPAGLPNPGGGGGPPGCAVARKDA